MTIELFSNITQLIVSIVCAVIATTFAVRTRKVEYSLVAGVIDTCTLGILYWVTYQFITDQTPQIFYVADISWFAMYLFLLALELYLVKPDIKSKRHFAMYIPFPIGIALTIYFCQWGDILLNVSYMTVLSFCGYFAIKNLIFGNKTQKALHIFCILFIITEYSLWVASCFWISDTWTNPYFWFDFAITLQIACFFPIAKKVVG